MNSPNHFRVNTGKITHDTIDGEVVIINFDSGSYYSMNNAAADIWEFIVNDATMDEIIEKVFERYDASHAEIIKAVTELVEELQQENIIAFDKAGITESIQAMGVKVENSRKAKKISFETPRLHKYTDMQELLLLDPIHEVDETGWPKGKADSPDDNE